MADLTLWQKWENASVVGHIRYLYKFEFPSRTKTTYVTYCTGRQDVGFDGHIYTPHPCVHGDIQKTQNDSEVGIQLGASPMWVEAVITNICRKLNLTIYRYRQEMLDAVAIFKGFANEYSIRNNVISMKFLGGLGDGNSNIILYYTQAHCNHDMYGNFCGLNFNDMKVEIPAGGWAVDTKKTIILLPEFAFDPTYWNNALLMYDIVVDENDHTFIYEQDNMAHTVAGNAFVTKYPISNLVRPTEYPLTVAPNCNLSLHRCRDIFGNMARSCGHPDLPLINYAQVDSTAGGRATGGPLKYIGESPYG